MAFHFRCVCAAMVSGGSVASITPETCSALSFPFVKIRWAVALGCRFLLSAVTPLNRAQDPDNIVSGGGAGA
jgi:hypothetical protein